MKSALVVVALVVVCCLVCLASSDALSASAIVMKIGHSQPVDHPRQKSFLKFKEIVESKTQGGIKVEIYPAGQLGSEAEQMESVKMGVTLPAQRAGLRQPSLRRAPAAWWPARRRAAGCTV